MELDDPRTKVSWLSRFGHEFDSDGGYSVRTRLKWFNATKGFGFVSPIDGAPDAFLHVSVLHRAGLQELGDQAELVCEIGQGPKGPQVMRIVETLSTGMSAPQMRPAPQPAAEEEMSGTVKWFKPDKGFGFVTADDSGKDVFVHKSVLRRSGLNVLEAGQRIQMRVQDVEKGREATWVMPL
jgi:CspA family cold shock protein